MGVTVKDVLVSTPVVVDITEELNRKFPLLGGFTIGNNSFVFAARKAKIPSDPIQHQYGQLFKVPISGGTMSESILVHLKHGNDIAYYNSNYYVAMGSRKEFNEEKQIAKFASNLEYKNNFEFKSKSGTLNGLAPLDYISKICHYSGTNFIAGNGLKLALCKLNEANRSFDEIGRFNLQDDKSVFYRPNYEDRAGQGIFYANHKIYNIISYKLPNEEYRYNDIAVYSVSEIGDTLKTTLETVYKCDYNTVPGKGDMELFEIEGIAALNGTTFYIALNQRNAAGDPCDAIYHVYLT